MLTNLIASLFVIIAILLLLLSVFMLVGWLFNGGEAILLPTVGLVVTISESIVTLLVLAAICVIIAGFIGITPKKMPFDGNA